MHEDIVVSNGVWKFTGNPDLICKCLSGKGCIQFPEKSNNGNNPFVSEDSTKTSGKICERVWKFHSYKTCERCGEAKKDVSVRPIPFFTATYEDGSSESLYDNYEVCEKCEKVIM